MHSVYTTADFKSVVNAFTNMQEVGCLRYADDKDTIDCMHIWLLPAGSFHLHARWLYNCTIMSKLMRSCGSQLVAGYSNRDEDQSRILQHGYHDFSAIVKLEKQNRIPQRMRTRAGVDDGCVSSGFTAWRLVSLRWEVAVAAVPSMFNEPSILSSRHTIGLAGCIMHHLCR
jgi:hypothetical protein